LVPSDDIIHLNSGQRRTLERIFAEPTPRNIRWNDIISLLEALGATIERRGGSSTRVSLGGRLGVFYAPHPRPETPITVVRRIADLLTEAGVQP
jgi:hypothetical protein